MLKSRVRRASPPRPTLMVGDEAACRRAFASLEARCDALRLEELAVGAPAQAAGGWAALVPRFRALRESLTSEGVEGALPLAAYVLAAEVCLRAGDLSEYLKCQARPRVHSAVRGAHAEAATTCAGAAAWRRRRGGASRPLGRAGSLRRAVLRGGGGGGRRSCRHSARHAGGTVAFSAAALRTGRCGSAAAARWSRFLRRCDERSGHAADAPSDGAQARRCASSCSVRLCTSISFAAMRCRHGTAGPAAGGGARRAAGRGCRGRCCSEAAGNCGTAAQAEHPRLAVCCSACCGMTY